MNEFVPRANIQLDTTKIEDVVEHVLKRIQLSDLS